VLSTDGSGTVNLEIGVGAVPKAQQRRDRQDRRNFLMQGSIWSGLRVRQSTKRHKRNPQFRHGERKALLQAITGGSLLLRLPVCPTNRVRAAEMVGSNAPYLNAAVVVLKAEDPALLHDVLSGRKSLRAAAAEVRKRATLIAAYLKSSHTDHGTAGFTIGVDEVFDEMIVPSL
jgi:hypothetical protein